MIRVGGTLFFALIASVFVAGAARAAGAATKADLLREAAALERQGDNGRALNDLDQAFAASGDATIQYDIGRLHERLKQPLEAFAAFGIFLDKATDAPALYRADASKRRQELRRGFSELTIRCNVAGAKVTVDKRDAGQTPLSEPVLALRGPHQVHVEKPGYNDFDSRLADDVRTVSVELVERPAAVTPPPLAAVVAPARPAAPPAVVVGDSGTPEVTIRQAAAPAGEPGSEKLSSSIAVTAGGVFWTAKEAVSSVTPGLTISGGHTVATFDQSRSRVSLGGKLAFTEINERATTTWWSLLVGAAVHREVGSRFAVFGGLDVGVLLLAGLQADSELLYRDAVSEVKSPGLFTVEIRPSVGIEYAISPRWALMVAPQAVWNPRPTTFFTYQSMLRFDVSAGASVRF